VIASHYAEPLQRHVATPSLLRNAPNEGAETIRELAAGETFDILDNSLGWAWGYAGNDRHVGYVPTDAVSG